MEIEFNPKQIMAPIASKQTTTRPGATPTNDAAQLQGMAELQRKLNDLALSRPEKMSQAAEALADVKYPPDQLLNGIAHLLAIKLNE